MNEQDRLRLQQKLGMFIPYGMSSDNFGHQEFIVMPKINYYMHPRITPVWIRDIKPDEVFVFGSNVQGIHGKGAALQALKWGARNGKGFGHVGRTYAIPTRERVNLMADGFGHKTERGRNFPLRTLPLDKIATYVSGFIQTTTEHPELNFLVTEIGCGHAGYTPEQIAPLFQGCLELPNIWLPQKFVDVLMELK